VKTFAAMILSLPPTQDFVTKRICSTYKKTISTVIYRIINFEVETPSLPKKNKYGKRSSATSITKSNRIIPASEFTFDPTTKSCHCPANKRLLITKEGIDQKGSYKLFFEGRLTDCRQCAIKQHCMVNPSSADTRKGHGRQESFIVESKRRPTILTG